MKRFLTILLVIGLFSAIFQAPILAKENFRIKILWQTNQILNQSPISEQQYAHRSNRNIDYYFGDWWWYARGYTECWVGTFSGLNYKIGEMVPGYQTRSLTQHKINQHFGLEAELRLFKKFWLGLSYLPTPTFVIDTVEQKDVFRFDDFQKLSEQIIPDYGTYYEYYMSFSRTSTIQKTSEKFFARNFNIYLKTEITEAFINIFGGIGLDSWQLIREVKKDQTIYNILPWEGDLISSKENNQTTTKKQWYWRPFALIGLQVDVYKGLMLGVQGKFFSQTKRFDYHHELLLPSPELDKNYWSRRLDSGAILFYLGYTF